MKSTFFTQLGIADLEKIHSQVLSWVFSSDCKGFNSGLSAQVQLLNKLFNTGANEILNSSTEVDFIDIFIETDNSIILIENKIKSSQHSNQLEKYIKLLADKKPNKNICCYFLTLFEEKASTDGWTNINYINVLAILQGFEDEISKEFHGLILKDYIQTIENLTSVIVHFISHPEKYEHVFMEGSNTKSQKRKLEPLSNSNQDFIRKHQLETALQKYYFNKVRSYLDKPEEYYIVETRGNGILGRHTHREIKINRNKFHLGMDFQNGTFKIMLIAVEYNSSSPNQIPEYVHTAFANMLGIAKEKGYIRHNKPRTRAQMSITNPRFKKEEWWKLNPKDFANVFMEELVIAIYLIENNLLDIQTHTFIKMD